MPYGMRVGRKHTEEWPGVKPVSLALVLPSSLSLQSLPLESSHESILGGYFFSMLPETFEVLLCP